ncbi:MAG TPA: hypothetical protein VGC63_10035 [Solirubrobacterales bacterium]|jgi:hypothetical protein
MEISVRTGLIAGVLALVLLSGCGSKDDSDSQANGEVAANGAEVLSAASLREAAGEESTPVYWAGEQTGTRLELSRPSKGRTYVRYLTGDAKAGDRRASFLTVSTYVQSKAVAALRRQGKRAGGAISLAPGNATVYYERTDPQSVYLAYPGVPVEIEVYDPNFKRALQIVNSGQIVAIG